MNKPLASLSPLHHRSAKHIKVAIPNTDECKSLIRKVKGRKWSRTHSCWYIPYTSEAYNQLRELFDVTTILGEEKSNLPPVINSKEEQLPSTVPQFVEYVNQGEIKKKFVGKKVLVKKLNQRWLVAHVPYDKTAWVNTIKNIAGRKWKVDKAGWLLPYVKTTFYQIRNHIGLENVKFDFQINKDIPEEYIPKPTGSLVQKKQNNYDKLTQAQKLAITKLEEQLTLRQYSYSTLKTYRNHLCGIFIFHKKKNPEELQPHNVEKYLIHLIRFKKIAESTQNQIINAYKAYVEKVLGRPKEWVNIPRPKKPKQLPNILSTEEVVQLLSVLENSKHKLLLMLIYSAGMRRGEVLNLLKRDVNISRRAIHIKGAKGKKDRYVVLAEAVVPQIKKYIKNYSPVHWLFEGQSGTKYSTSSLQKVFHKALKLSKVNPYATLHTLRHSYATHCMEQGHSLKHVQEALGHGSIKTTELYLHLTSDALNRLKSPIDNMDIQ